MALSVTRKVNDSQQRAQPEASVENPRSTYPTAYCQNLVDQFWGHQAIGTKVQVNLLKLIYTLGSTDLTDIGDLDHVPLERLIAGCSKGIMIASRLRLSRSKERKKMRSV